MATFFHRFLFFSILRHTGQEENYDKKYTSPSSILSETEYYG